MRHALQHFAQVLDAPDLFELPSFLEFFGERDGIDSRTPAALSSQIAAKIA